MYFFGAQHHSDILRTPTSDLTNWSKIGNMPANIGAGYTIVTDNYIYVSDGFSGSSIYRASRSDPTNFSYYTSDPIASSTLKAFKYGSDKYYLVSGAKTWEIPMVNGEPNFASTITHNNNVTLEVTNQALIIIGDTIYAFGSNIYSTTIGSWGSWSQLGSYPNGDTFGYANLFTVGNKLYGLGDYWNRNTNYNDIYSWDLINNMLKTPNVNGSVFPTDYPTDKPYYITTTDSSNIDLPEGVSQINSLTVTYSEPTNTSIKGLASFDGRNTWEKWNGSEW